MIPSEDSIEALFSEVRNLQNQLRAYRIALWPRIAVNEKCHEDVQSCTTPEPPFESGAINGAGPKRGSKNDVT